MADSPPGQVAQAPPDAGRPPSPEQADAISDRERDLFLAAGAGTGKTTVLVERFCETVCAEDGPDAGVGVEGVLAFTFTERAAAELKRRIRRELLIRSERQPEGRRARRLRSLARDSQAAWISTIHSFCRRLLSAHPLAAGLDPRFRVLNEPQAARVASEAFEQAIERFCAAGDAERLDLAAAYRLPALRTLVRAAHDELRARGDERPRLPALAPPDVDGAARELHHAAEAALAATAGGRRRGKADECLALIAEARAGSERRRPREEEVARWRFSSAALGGPEIERYHEARATLERRLVEDGFADRYDALRALVEMYADDYAALKQERSALDFEDLQLRAHRLLRSNAEIRRRYQRQFRHLMVDEFQDTNALQLELLNLLHTEGGVAVNRLFTVGDELQSIYAFRHADVEVFRWQQDLADRARDDAGRVRRLTGNFRARPELIALTNHVGRALFGRDYMPLAAGTPGKAAVADPPAEVLVTEQKGWEDDPGLDVSADERAQPWRVAEARFLAERLRELHHGGVPRGDIAVLLRSFSYVEAYEAALEKAGLAPHVVGGRGYWSRQQVADVRNLLGCVANPLDDRALLGALASPACGVAPDTLWLLRRAAGDGPVWSVLSWLYGPAPARGGGERPAGQASAGEGGEADGGRLAAWRERAAELAEHVPGDDAAALRELVPVLLDLRAEAPRLPLDSLIERVISATGYDLALLMRPGGRRRMANVRKLMRLAREFEADRGRDLRAFLDYAAAEAEQDGREAEAAVDAEGQDGVRLMTVHAAKGLEFPVVAVADLGRRLVAGAPPALRLEPARGRTGERTGEGATRVGLRLARLGRKGTPIFDYAELEEKAVEREREEERRILHVAMTRAERHLILSGVLELEGLWDGPKDSEPLLGPVLRALGWRNDRDQVELEWPSLGPGLEGPAGEARVAVRTCRPTDADASDERRPPEVTAARPPRAGEDRPLQDPELAPLEGAPPATLRALSYSALALHERCGYRFYAERVLGLRPRLPFGGRAADEWHGSSDAGELATRYAQGRVVHGLLEQAARSHWAQPDPARAAALLRREGTRGAPEEVRRVVRLVEGFLEAPIRSEIGRAARVHPEAPFAFRAGGLLVRGEIDLLADLGQEVLVVDYKSDALDGGRPGERMAGYEVQRLIYALAALRRYGKPVRVAYVFLERPREPVEARFWPNESEAVLARVAALARAVAEGRFEVTDRPERSLCLDCPARERLCVHGPELTLRDSA